MKDYNQNQKRLIVMYVKGSDFEDTCQLNYLPRKGEKIMIEVPNHNYMEFEVTDIVHTENIVYVMTKKSQGNIKAVQKINSLIRFL